MENSVNHLSIKDRFIEIRKHFALSQKEFGQKLGISGSAVGLIETGRTANPGADVIVAAASKLGISLDWLLMGRGEMIQSGYVINDPIKLDLDKPHHLKFFEDAIKQNPELISKALEDFKKENPEEYENMRQEAHRRVSAEQEVLMRVYRFRPLKGESTYDVRLTVRMNMNAKDIRALLKKPVEEGGLRGVRIGNDYLVSERAIRAWFGDN